MAREAIRYMSHRHSTMSTRVDKVNAYELTRQRVSTRVMFSVSVLVLVRPENCRLHYWLVDGRRPF